MTIAPRSPRGLLLFFVTPSMPYGALSFAEGLSERF